MSTSQVSSDKEDDLKDLIRSAVTHDVGKYIERERSNPELNCPNLCRVIVLDDAGEWRKSNSAFMADMTRLGIHVIVNPKGDKRQSAFAQNAVQKMKLMVQAGLIDMRLPATWWQRLADYSWHVHNLYPVQRKAHEQLELAHTPTRSCARLN